MDFNSEEDLVLLTTDGRLFILDIMNSEVCGTRSFSEFIDIQN
jgi:hypothetical protein